MLNHLKQHFGSRRTGGHGGLDIARHIGPGLLVTVGFIDPGNWASNMAAGSQFGYALLWIVTLSTIMLIVLQHNAAHLGIATGACLAEATTRYLPASLDARYSPVPISRLSPPPWPKSWVARLPFRCSLGCPCARAASSWRQYRWRCS